MFKAITSIGLVALAIASPVKAQTQLERLLGVEPGAFTTAQLAEMKAKSTEQGNEARVFINVRVSTRGAPPATLEFARTHAAESDESGDRTRVFGVRGSGGNRSQLEKAYSGETLVDLIVAKDRDEITANF